jgi:hypothetical protein
MRTDPHRAKLRSRIDIDRDLVLAADRLGWRNRGNAGGVPARPAIRS